MVIRWKAVYFIVVLFVFQFYLVCNFGTFINLDLALLRVKGLNNVDNSLLEFSPSLWQSTHQFLYKENPLSSNKNNLKDSYLFRV